MSFIKIITFNKRLKYLDLNPITISIKLIIIYFNNLWIA